MRWAKASPQESCTAQGLQGQLLGPFSRLRSDTSRPCEAKVTAATCFATGTQSSLIAKLLEAFESSLQLLDMLSRRLHLQLIFTAA